MPCYGSQLNIWTCHRTIRTDTCDWVAKWRSADTVFSILGVMSQTMEQYSSKFWVEQWRTVSSGVTVICIRFMKVTQRVTGTQRCVWTESSDIFIIVSSSWYHQIPKPNVSFAQLSFLFCYGEHSIQITYSNLQNLRTRVNSSEEKLIFYINYSLRPLKHEYQQKYYQ